MFLCSFVKIIHTDIFSPKSAGITKIIIGSLWGLDIFSNFDGFKCLDYEFIHANTGCALVFMIIAYPILYSIIGLLIMKFTCLVMIRVGRPFERIQKSRDSQLLGSLPKICESFQGLIKSKHIDIYTYSPKNVQFSSMKISLCVSEVIHILSEKIMSPNSQKSEQSASGSER